ncbi:hypothetical protein CASFOL_012450 [Castilleja foliolosa]|uniref:Uncharacterized protein n=1 Tax=Castilleja foliolosa TaxID=1961234 RepID=A0ABD3DL83_9LAMI
MTNISFDFDSLRDLHDSVNRSLHSPHTKLEIISNDHRNLVHDLSEASLRMADSCSAAKDLLLIAKSHLQNLQTSFRRTSVADQGGDNQFSSHRLPRKQLRKAILKRLDSLKNARVADVLPPPEDRSLAAVVDLLREVRSTALLMVGSLLSLIALPDSGRKDPVFRLRFTRVDSLRLWEKCDAAEIREAAKRLEEVEMVVEDMEAEIEHMFRRLIRTRASLLNILTT